MESHLPHELLLANQAFLQRLARSLVADPASAEDLVQDTSLAALRQAPHASSSARAWLARVMRNLAARRARDESRRRSREADVARPEADELGARLAAHLDVQRRVVEAVARLEEPYRTAILLRYVHDLSAAQVAERLGAPLATVRTRLARALERLRRELDARDEPGTPAWSAVLLAGLDGLRPSAAGAAVAAGGAVMGIKLIATGGAVAAAAVAGTWWMLRDAVGPTSGQGVAKPADTSAEVEPEGIVAPSTELAHESDGPERAPIRADPAPAVLAADPPDWSLDLAPGGWSAADAGPLRIEIRRVDAAESVLAVEVPLAPRIELDLGTLMAAPERRPDRFTLRVDHPDFLPAELGVLVPEELMGRDVAGGRLQAALELERTSTVLTGRVELEDASYRSRARVALFRLDGDRPAREPVETVPLRDDLGYRLRAGAGSVWVVVAFLAKDPAGLRARPATLRVQDPPSGEVELELLVLGPGVAVQGRVFATGGGAPAPGSIFIQSLQFQGYPGTGLAWIDGRFELLPDSMNWGEDGSFLFEGLAPGAYRLTLASLGMPDREIPELQVQNSSSSSLDIHAPASDLVVPFDRIHVLLEVVDDRGPVSRATVNARWKLGGGSYERGTKADALGRVMLECAPADGMELSAEDVDGIARLSIAPQSLVADQRLELRLEKRLAAGTVQVSATGSTHLLPTDGGMNAYLYDLEALDPALQSVLLYSIPYSTSSGNVSIEPSSQGVRMSYRDGTWTFEGLPRSRILVRFLPSSMQREERFLVLGTEHTVDLRSEANAEIAWELELGGFVRLDLSAIKDLKSAGLSTADSSSLVLNYFKATGQRGSITIGPVADGPALYDVQPNLAAGSYRLEIRLRDDTRHSLPVDVVAGEVTDVVVRPEDL